MITLFKAKMVLTTIEIISFIVAIIVVNKFVDYLKKKRMRIFAVYRICAGILLLVLVFMNVLK